MHSHDLTAWIPTHAFNEGNPAAERGMRWVLIITTAMMTVEIVAGWWFNSMALLADGWHMSSHTLAIGLSAVAYAAARRFAHDTRFTFGTWKIEVLGGFASAIFLFGIAVYMGVESVIRIANPRPIAFNEAVAVASLGLLVNVVCAWIIGGTHHGHEHADHDHEDEGHHHHHDLNVKSAYVHIVADALTSVLAIAALLGGKFFAWNWLDPVMGIVGGLLIAVWAVNLIRDTSRVLLDCEMDRPIVSEIKAAVASLPPSGDTRIADLHVWRVGRCRYACILSVVTDDPDLTPARVKALLDQHEELAHVTAEVNLCPEHAHLHR
jgi:cation diffusion facilitator family transporter